jgi:glutamine amidotransferase
MARLIGFIANRPDLGARALATEARSLSVKLPELAPDSAEGPGSVSWGLGFYQGGEVLLKRRPFDERRVLSFAELAKDVRAEVLVGHIRTATVGSLRTENTHPFRYRQWLFASTGTVPAAEAIRARVLESMPQFLARDVRGETDAELVFYTFLSFLHDAGQLDRPDVSAAVARDAIRSTFAMLSRVCAEETQQPLALNLVLACGDYVVGVRTHETMGFTLLAGRSGLEKLFGNESLSRTKVPHLVSARLGLVASDFDEHRVPASLVELRSGQTVTLAHTDDPHVEAL